MEISIAVESPLQDDVRALIAALNAHLAPLSPPQFQFKMTAEEMARDDTTVLIARDGAGRAVGCGALRVHEAGMAEVKRMFALPEVRGERVGTRLLDAIETLARERGITSLKLETGNGAGFEGAMRLYRRHGFSVCPAFLDYPESPYSAFYEKALPVGAAKGPM